MYAIIGGLRSGGLKSGGLMSGGLMSGGLMSGGLMSGGIMSGGLKSAHRSRHSSGVSNQLFGIIPPQQPSRAFSCAI